MAKASKKVCSLGSTKTLKQCKVQKQHLKEVHKKYKKTSKQSGKQAQSCTFYEEFYRVSSVRNVVNLSTRLMWLKTLLNHTLNSTLMMIQLMAFKKSNFRRTKINCCRYKKQQLRLLGESEKQCKASQLELLGKQA